MLTIEQHLQARHFVIKAGQAATFAGEQRDSRLLSVSYDGQEVAVKSRGETRVFPLPRPARCAPDPGDIYSEVGLDDEAALLESFSPCHIDASLSCYQERRLVNDSLGLKEQRTGFFVVVFYEEPGVYVYADLDPGRLPALAAMHALPKRTLKNPGLPLVLSGNVVGHIFHEYAHLLETDLLDTHTARHLEGRRVFTNKDEIRVFEDPGSPTLGFNAFTDDGRVPGRMALIDDNSLAGFLDSFSYPYRNLGCGYLGLGEGWFPIPRSTNLTVECERMPCAMDRFLAITELNLQLESADPLETAVHVAGGECLYVEQGIPAFRAQLVFDIRTTLQALVAQMTFVDTDTGVPPMGGMCVKAGAQVRSAQVSPPALWQSTIGWRECTARS